MKMLDLGEQGKYYTEALGRRAHHVKDVNNIKNQGVKSYEDICCYIGKHREKMACY